MERFAGNVSTKEIKERIRKLSNHKVTKEIEGYLQELRYRKEKLDDFLLTKEQEYWFNKGWNLAYEKMGLPETSKEIYWKKQREIIELKMLDIINLLPKEYGYYKKAIKIMVNTKYFDSVFKGKN